VLLVEHDAEVAELARRYLERDGLTVRVAHTAAAAAVALGAAWPAVIVLDLTMPGITAGGIRRLAARGQPAAPVLVCVGGPAGTGPAHAGVAQDGVPRLARPFSPRALVTRVRAAMQGPRAAGRAAAAGGGSLTSGALTLDLGEQRVSVGGTAVRLTGTEFALLAFLVGNTGRVFTRAELVTSVWGGTAVVGARTVDLYVAQLRAKLGRHSPIRTVRGIGYAARAQPGEWTLAGQQPG
jgi:DNA-binding response OmpR family regulator